MLYKVIMSRSFLFRKASQKTNGAKLMEPRKDYCIIPLAVLHALDKVLQDIQQTVGLQDMVPHIVRRVVRISLNRRIGCANIKRQEVRIRSSQLCGHEHQVVIHDEVYQAGVQHPVARIAVGLVLNNAVFIALTCPLIL